MSADGATQVDATDGVPALPAAMDATVVPRSSRRFIDTP
jgi:hypothetical protein